MEQTLLAALSKSLRSIIIYIFIGKVNDVSVAISDANKPNTTSLAEELSPTFQTPKLNSLQYIWRIHCIELWI
jgi:hypothetical protein